MARGRRLDPGDDSERTISRPSENHVLKSRLRRADDAVRNAQSKPWNDYTPRLIFVSIGHFTRGGGGQVQYGITTPRFTAAIWAPSESRTTTRIKNVPGCTSKEVLTLTPERFKRSSVASLSRISMIFSNPVMRFPFSSKIAVATVRLFLLRSPSRANLSPLVVTCATTARRTPFAILKNCV